MVNTSIYRVDIFQRGSGVETAPGKYALTIIPMIELNMGEPNAPGYRTNPQNIIVLANYVTSKTNHLLFPHPGAFGSPIFDS